jgi:hypothetical protein
MISWSASTPFKPGAVRVRNMAIREMNLASFFAGGG